MRYYFLEFIVFVLIVINIFVHIGTNKTIEQYEQKIQYLQEENTQLNIENDILQEKLYSKWRNERELPGRELFMKNSDGEIIKYGDPVEHYSKR